jgi:2-polyprenyl-3-methyl-5-hydroxy-6-metoxy-1,4-benzoquinol methylase
VEEKLVVDFFTEEKKHWWHIAKRALVRQFINGSNLNILVAGVGGGMICEELKLAGHNVVGIDISPVSCEYVKRALEITVINGDLEKPLPFPKESFDCIIIADVLEHLHHDKELLTEAFRCLKCKGMVIITAPAYPHMWSIWDERLHHKRRYSLSAIKENVIRAGFSLKKVSYYHILLYPLVYFYRIMLRLPKGEHSGKSDFAIMPGGIVSGFLTFIIVWNDF